ncbi:hypothetical protein [uncultured Fibrobacter sp.]|uniref:hypothetical protein n=1 Tax=uncultured Fibrobacter sp. TaxID=261512 RepID=UPI00280423C3|nr:hypothetical protein [uncultured Fibrobacter sp.]
MIFFLRVNSLSKRNLSPQGELLLAGRKMLCILTSRFSYVPNFPLTMVRQAAAALRQAQGPLVVCFDNRSKHSNHPSTNRRVLAAGH